MSKGIYVMKKLIKRIAAINDMSVFGKCSLTVAIPTLSAMGYEVCPIATSYLSAHTGFESPAIFDLTDTSDDIIKHLDKLGVEFDGVYTGYIPSVEQMEKIKHFVIDKKVKGGFILIDPVLGDDGQLYKGFDNRTVKKMRELCLFADLVTPNFTEACLLTNCTYKDNCNEKDARILVDRLNAFGMANKIIITSVPFGDKKNMIVSEYGELEIIECDYVDGDYCGAGDLFASYVMGEMLGGKTVKEAAVNSHSFLEEIIKETYKMGGTWEQGLVFEKFLNIKKNK